MRDYTASLEQLLKDKDSQINSLRERLTSYKKNLSKEESLRTAITKFENNVNDTYDLDQGMAQMRQTMQPNMGGYRGDSNNQSMNLLEDMDDIEQLI